MKTSTDSDLAAELQELYLENKERLTDVGFLEDETRFINKLLNDFFMPAVQQNHLQEMQAIQIQLKKLTEQREELKTLIEKNQHLLESYIRNPGSLSGMDIIDENGRMEREIKVLRSEDRRLKKELFLLVEILMKKIKPSHLLDKE